MRRAYIILIYVLAASALAALYWMHWKNDAELRRVEDRILKYERQIGNGFDRGKL